MDLTYTPEEEAFRSELRGWLASSVPAEWRRPGFWQAMSDDESFDKRRQWEHEKALAGFAGIAWPTEFGGRGGTPGMKAIYDEELALAEAPVSVNPVGLSFLAPTVMLLGSEEQKKEIIGPMLRAEVIWTQGFSEPGAGSDLAALRTAAAREGDELIVNGQKVWTTYAMWGDRMFTLARTQPYDAGHKHNGLSMLLLDMHQEGVEARPIKQMSGAREFGEVFLTDARCSVDDVLGGLDNGWATAMLLLSFERGSSAIGQYTAFRRMLDQIVQVARQVVRDGAPAAQDPVLRQRLAGTLVDLECLKYLSWHILTQAEQGRDLGFEASMTKMMWSETFQEMWDVFDEVLGPDAMVRSPTPGMDLSAYQELALWSRSVTIWGGSAQVQRNVVAERVLGLPR